MKKLILLALTCTAIVLSHCTPSPSPGPATPTPTPTPTPTYSMTATETALAGDWIWDKTEIYNAGSLLSVTNHTSDPQYVGTHMNLKTNYYMNYAWITTYGYNLFVADYYCPNFSGGALSTTQFWSVNPMSAGESLATCGWQPASGYLNTLNSTTLITQTWVIGQTPNGTKVYYHK